MTPKEKAIESLENYETYIHPTGSAYYKEAVIKAIDIALREQRIIYEKLIRDTVKEVITQTDKGDKK